jgi:S-adenosyl-L-methionine hydrolase (adenosine-forming)
VILTLLTDYGQADEFVGVCHAVARGILPPEVPVVDLTHGIARHDVRHGALSLRNALPYVPVGVHVAVVDPQVGTERRALAVRCDDGRVLVGPDNGLLSLAWERAGGAVEAIDITRSQHRLEPVSATFHGRDVFVPVAAHLAAGAELLDAGEAVAIDELEAIELPEPRMVADVAVAHALLIDGYGNVSLDLRHEHMLALDLTIGARVEVASGGRSAAATVVQTFADVAAGELLVYEDAWGAVALAVNRGDAAATLGIERDAEVRIFRA